MDKAQYVHKRKKRYMAQTLEEFERLVEPLIPPEIATEFKGIVRRKMHALALDSAEIINLNPGEEINGHAVELRDRLHVEGRPTQRSRTA
jgi:hypothetical protein